jgi:hypothetical protein
MLAINPGKVNADKSYFFKLSAKSVLPLLLLVPPRRQQFETKGFSAG